MSDNGSDASVLKRAPFMIIWGPPGGGKTTCVARSFPDYRYFTSGDTVLRALVSLKEMKPEEGIIIPKWSSIQKVRLDDSGAMIEQDVEAKINEMLTAYWQKAIKLGDKFPFKGVVLDEWNTMAGWIYEYMKKSADAGTDKRFKSQRGRSNMFAVIDAFKAFHVYLAQWCRTTGHGVVLVMHGREASYEEEQTSRKFNQLKYKRGPNFPIGTLIAECCAAADIVVELAVSGTLDRKDASERVLLTQTTDDSERKFRDWRVKPEEPMDSPDALRKLLIRCGYDLGVGGIPPTPTVPAPASLGTDNTL